MPCGRGSGAGGLADDEDCRPASSEGSGIGGRAVDVAGGSELGQLLSGVGGSQAETADVGEVALGGGQQQLRAFLFGELRSVDDPGASAPVGLDEALGVEGPVGLRHGAYYPGCARLATASA
jgi:hypothetical protein